MMNIVRPIYRHFNRPINLFSITALIAVLLNLTTPVSGSGISTPVSIVPSPTAIINTSIHQPQAAAPKYFLHMAMINHNYPPNNQPAPAGTATQTPPPAPQLTPTRTRTAGPSPTATPTLAPGQPTATPTRTATSNPAFTPTQTYIPTSIPPTPTRTNTATSTAPTATSGAPTHTPVPGSRITFPVGPGWADVIPHQIVRTGNDKLYFFGIKGDTSSLIYAYWTSTPGLPSSGSDFSGSTQLSDSANLISVEVVYDGANIIHVLANGLDGQIKDHPFDITSNTFKTAKVLDTTGGTVSGGYIGTSGLSAMFDRSGRLQVLYWTNANHIFYRAYTYNPASDTLTLVSGPTQLDANGSANHPVLAASPLDGSLTAAWVSQASSPAQILSKTQSSGSWGSIQTVSAAPVWTSPNSGINIDQGPSLIITPDGVKHLTYIEDWRVSSPYDYGRVHEAVSSGSSWADTYIGSYSHDPALATDNAGAIYIIGHGYPLNSGCTSVDEMCVYTRNANGTWNAPTVLIAPTGSQSFDSSPSVKWSVVGFNRPETVEFVFSEVGIGSYTNPILYYGRINKSTP